MFYSGEAKNPEIDAPCQAAEKKTALLNRGPGGRPVSPSPDPSGLSHDATSQCEGSVPYVTIV